MCRYSHGISHKSHYACFSCRKTFKRKLLRDIDKDSSFDRKIENYPAKCPECSELMADMGLDFESPKKSDLKAWIHTKNLFENGITFHSCGCSGPGYIPKDREKLIEFLIEKKIEFIEHRRFWSNRIEPKNDSEKSKDWSQNAEFLFSAPNNLRVGTRKNWKYDKTEAAKYWTEKINELEERITNANNT